MIRCANDMLCTFLSLVKQLASTLGSDTADLNMRIGIHSGAVTAGVLRADRARFQLFGDTVNTASRMESTGSPGRIQVSQETFKELEKMGKSRWLVQRDEKVVAKGKGELQTFWVSKTPNNPIINKESPIKHASPQLADLSTYNHDACMYGGIPALSSIVPNETTEHTTKHHITKDCEPNDHDGNRDFPLVSNIETSASKIPQQEIPDEWENDPVF